MVALSNRLEKMKTLVEEEYFVINRARQYGKTTTLFQLKRLLADEYTVISISFQGPGDKSFECEETFCQEFLKTISDYLESSSAAESWIDDHITTFSELSRHITKRCQGKRIVLMIDEVDRASNHWVFLTFLGMLRTKYQADAYEQLTTYMSERGEEKGYLLTFDFRQKKEIKQEWIKAHGKSILEVQV